MNIKKLDEQDVIFIDEPWTKDEQKRFSDLLRKKKEKKSAKQKTISLSSGTPLGVHIARV